MFTYINLDKSKMVLGPVYCFFFFVIWFPNLFFLYVPMIVIHISINDTFKNMANKQHYLLLGSVGCDCEY